MLYVGLGQAEGIDTQTVVRRVIDDCSRQLKGRIPKAGIIFAGPYFEYDQLLSTINDTFPKMSLVGCSTSGNFSSLHGVSDDSITLVLFASDHIRFGAGIGKNLSIDYQTAVSQAISTAASSLPDRPALCLAFPDAYKIPFEPILQQLGTDLGPDCPVFGGVAGTLLTEWSDIVQFYGRETLRDSLPILMMSGPVKYRFSIAHSWRPVGNRASVQRSNDRRVYTIGSLTAVDYYRNYLGYHEEPVSEFMLAVYNMLDTTHYYIRTPLYYHDDGSITFSGNIPEGSEVQLTEATREDLINDTLATSKALNAVPADWFPALSINFSCGYRKTILGTEVDKEMECLQNYSPPGFPITGFFSFGEISPLSSGGPSIYHEATLITLLIGPGLRELPQPELPDPLSTKLIGYNEPKQNELLRRKLIRSELSRKQLESMKEFSTQMHRQVILELEEARVKIQKKEEQLRESEEKYRRIVQTTGQGFVLMDEYLTIVDANAAYCHLIRAQLAEVLNRALLDSVIHEEQNLFLSKIYSQQRIPHRQFEGTLVTRKGERVPVLVNSNVLRNDAGGVIGHMAFFTDLTEQKKALTLAGEVQRNLLPQRVPNIFGLDIAGKNVSCEEVGGDYYDFFLQQTQARNTLSVAVGDISGHGVDAALLMSSARSFLRLHVSQKETTARMIESMNKYLADDTSKTGHFMSLFYMTIRSDLKSLEWVRAGHDPAVLFKHEEKKLEDLKGSGMVLGVDPNYPYKANVRENLRNGDIIAIGTDGIWETRNNIGEMFGREQFKMLLQRDHHLPAGDILENIFKELDLFREGQKADDDVTLVIIKIQGSSPDEYDGR